jgi:hypothetical protein
MPKRACKFNSELEKEFPYIKKTKSDSDVRCLTCNTHFSVSHGGKSDINQHIKSEKHKLALVAASSSNTVSKFFKSSTCGSKELELAAAEGVFAYHTVSHSQSFRSMDCTTKIIQKLFEPKFTCARTKSEAVVVNVLAPLAESKLKSDLSKAKFVSVSIDSSNHKELKLFPTLVRFFDDKTGVNVKLLELQALPGETSDIICDHLISVVKNANVFDKIIGFSADNTNTNFGGAARHGKNNVFYKLKNSLGKDVVGIGCAAHIINNSIQTAADSLPIDIEVVVVKIYAHFYIYTVRVESFKEFCEEAAVEYKKLLGYSKTRWLALMPAVERLLKLFEPLKTYFLANEKTPKLLKDFFNNPCAEVWLFFVHSQAAIFHSAVLQVEGQSVCAVQVAAVLSDLRRKCEERLVNKFVPLVVRNLITQTGEDVDKENIVNTICSFYENCIEYLNMWAWHFDDMKKFDWICLKQVPEWENIEGGIGLVPTKFSKINISDNELFDEVSYLKQYVTKEQISKWTEEKMPLDQRWVEILTHFNNQNVPVNNIKLMVSFFLCLPGTNAPVERVFSIINDFWSQEKSQMKMSTLKAIMFVKLNFGMSCDQFLAFIKEKRDILRKIHSSEKYENQA